MDTKQILAAVSILIGTFILIIGTVVGIYYFYPELLGFTPKLSTVQRPNVAMTKSDSLAAQKKKDSTELSIPYDSLKKMAFSLKDSLYNKREIIQNYNDSISGLVKRILDLNSNESKLNDSVNTYKKQLATVVSNMKEFQELVAKKDSLNIVVKDSLSEKNLVQFAKIYNNSAPTEVAKILEKIDGKDAAKILKIMQPKKAGKVLEAMKPEFAAEILLKGALE